MKLTFFLLFSWALVFCCGCSSSTTITTEDRALIDNELRKDSSDVLIEVEQLPEPIGGVAGIMSKITYPGEAKKNGVEGTVIVLCTVDTSGDVTETKLIRGIGFGCDERAIRAIQTTKFKPGRHKGRVVTTRLTIPLRFRLSR